MVSYPTSIATTAVHVSRTVSEIHQLIGQNRPILSTLVFGAPVRGEAVGVKQRPSVTKTGMMGLSGGKRISTKCLAVLIQSTRVPHAQTEMLYTRASVAGKNANDTVHSSLLAEREF